MGISAEKFCSEWFGGGGLAQLYGKVAALAAYGVTTWPWQIVVSTRFTPSRYGISR